MKLGLQIPDFTWPDGPGRLGSTLATIAVWRIKPLEIIGERVIPAATQIEVQTSPAG